MALPFSLSPVTFGAMAYDSGIDDEARIAVMRAALDAGITSFDTAPLYGFGRSERLLGRAIRGRRDEVRILTKVGLRWDDEHGDVLFATPERTVRKDGRPESIRREIDQSLERLGVETIDLIQVHHPDPTVPLRETMDALEEARLAGLVRAIGVSNHSPAEIREAARALGDTPLATVQEQYSLLDREVERSVLPTSRELGAGLLCYSPLAQGILAGKLLDGGRLADDDWRRHQPAFFPRNLEKIHGALRNVLTPIAEARGATLAQTALAWLLAQPGVTSVIAGARTEAHAKANFAAASITLSDDELGRARRAFEGIVLENSPGRRERAKAWAKRRLGKLRGWLPGGR